MPYKTELILQHGWGFQASAWDPWYEHLLKWSTVGTIDRGYFNSPQSITGFAADANFRILVTHSLGLHLCADSLLRQSDLLVIISGFQEIHPEDESLRLRSQKVLKRMKEKLLTSPKEVLHDFYCNCYQGGLQITTEEIATAAMLGNQLQQLPGDLDLDLLLADFERLDRGVMDIEALKSVKHILILHGESDKIVPVEKSQSLKSQLPNARLITLGQAGHALPFTHSTWCWQAICGTLNSLSPDAELILAAHS